MRRPWIWLRSQLWFGPAVLTLAGIGLALGLIELDLWLDVGRPTLGVGADGARGVLTAIATSVVNVAGVAFSITVVALALSASQYSSRVLRNFMRDRTNQVVLGVLVGTFAYCIVVLRTIHGGDDGQQLVPSVAVFGGVALAFVAIGHFVYFIHHIAASIQASSIVCAVAGDTMDAVDALFPDELGADEPDATARCELADRGGWRTVPARRTGYLQQIDDGALLRIARDAGRVVRIEYGIGRFVIAGTPLVSLAGDADVGADVADRLARVFTIASYRTVEQDPEFGIRQLTDVALKALSPGVNDTTTAVMCVDWLAAVLHRLVHRRMPTAARRDGEALRVVAHVPTFAGLVAAAFEPIRRNAAGNQAVLLRQMEALERLLAATPNAARRAALVDEVGAVADAVERTIPAARDRQDVERLAARLLHADDGRRGAQPAAHG